MVRGKVVRVVALMGLSIVAVWSIVAMVGYGKHAWGRDGIERESPRKRQSATEGFGRKRGACRSIIEMTVTFFGDNIKTGHKIVVNGQEKFHDTLRFEPVNGFFWNWGGLNKIRKTFRIDNSEQVLTIRHEVSPRYSPIRNNKRSRLGDVKYELRIAGYCWLDKTVIEEAPKLARNSFEICARPWALDPSDPDFRIQTISIPFRRK